MNFREELNTILQEETYVYDIDLLRFSDKLYKNRVSIPKLYRYVPANLNNIDSILSETIYLSEVGKMNDIFEGINTYIDLDTRDTLDALKDIVYMKSFSETKDNLVMWGTYAENYTGLCIEYDLTDMHEPEYYYHLFPVCYDSAKAKMKNNLRFVADELQEYKKSGLGDDSSFLSDILPLYLKKAKQWEYEQEWRILVSYLQIKEPWAEGGIVSEDEVKYQYAINNQKIPFPYINKVFIGPNASETVKECVIKACQSKGIPVSLTVVSQSDYALEELPVY